MSYTYKKKIANRNNYGGKRSTSKIKYLVIHFTANDGDTDENNGKYFANNIVKASAHYFVDDDSVTQSVPDNYVAWSVGGSKYSDCKTTGGGKLYGSVTNTNSLSIELCDDVKNGKIYPSAGTIANALELTKSLMKKYNIPVSRVIRHFDVNGKKCPAYWCGTSTKNALWETAFLNKLGNVPTKKKADDKKLNLDGIWGTDTTRMTQKVLGTVDDGIVSNQPTSCKQYLVSISTASWKFKSDGYKGGSAMVKAIQKLVGATVDGYCGTKTIKAMQNFLKKKKYFTGSVNGKLNKATVIAWQKYINSRIK